jgi:dipeptidyl aminopeptidase/acylaminoacyl peptidase
VSASVHPDHLAPSQRRRGALRRFLETRGLVGDHLAPHLETRLVAADGTRLAGTYLPGPAAHGPAVLLLHGFAAHRKKPAYAYLADGLSRHLAVLSLDLRGHGGSAGRSTLGDREALDALAGVDWLRGYGHPWVAMVGLSMGATTALHASALGAATDAVVAVSAPARFRDDPGTAAMRRLQSVWETPWKRRGLRALLKVHVVAPAAWQRPRDPEHLVSDARPPLLVVHGEDDAYFPVTDAEDLVRAAAGPATLWIEPAGFGHAEDGVTPGFVAALAEALLTVRTTGRFPARDTAR